MIPLILETQSSQNHRDGSSLCGSAGQEPSIVNVCEDVGLIPGLAQWVKDQALPQAAAQVTDAAWIWWCCGYGVALQLQF